MCEPLKVLGLCPGKQSRFGIDRNSRDFGQGGIIPNPEYCHDKVFILLDKGNFSTVPPGARRGDAGHKFVCLEVEVQLAQPTAIPKGRA